MTTNTCQPTRPRLKPRPKRNIPTQPAPAIQRLRMGSSRKLQDAPFAIYCDEPNSLLSPDSSYGSTFDDAASKYNDTRADSPVQSVQVVDITPAGYGSTTEYDNDNSSSYVPALRRNITATSVSSLPPSALPSENEGQYTPTKGPRPSYQSPGLRRVPIGASPSDRLSPHKSLRPSGQKKSANVRASPRPRTRERQDEVETQLYPLVLLHVTILPPTLPWSQAAIRRALPRPVKDNMALLKSRLSELVLQRGVLIQHPQEDFQLLEERVMEALGLDVSSGASCDSGDEYGGFDEYDISEHDDSCRTCGDPNCFSQRVPKSWEVRVYAANGLMRAGAWAAAWSEMERVDFEILPHIPRHVRRRLDGVQAEEDDGTRGEPKRVLDPRGQEIEPRGEEMPLMRQKSPEPVEVLLSPPRTISETTSHPIEVPLSPPKAPTESLVHPIEVLLSPPKVTTPASQPPNKRKWTKVDTSLPAAYRPKEIPLRILLGNYLYVLAQDRRKVAILFLLATILFSTVHGLRAAKGSGLADMYDGHGEVDMPNTLSIDAGGLGIGNSAWGLADGHAYAAQSLEPMVEMHEPVLTMQRALATDGMNEEEERFEYEPKLVEEKAAWVQPPHHVDGKEILESDGEKVVKDDEGKGEAKNDEKDKVVKDDEEEEEVKNGDKEMAEDDGDEKTTIETEEMESIYIDKKRMPEIEETEVLEDNEKNVMESINNEHNDSVEAEEQTANDSCPAGNMFILTTSEARFTE